MGIISDEISQAIKEYNIPSAYLSIEEYNYFFTEICNKYADSNFNYPLWDQLISRGSLRDDNGWKYISDFVKDTQAILLLEEETESFGVVLKNGFGLKQLLENTFHFVFYVTNYNFDYLICFNDHDYLIACGSAENWLLNIKRDINH
jgi:hypothetical protein